MDKEQKENLKKQKIKSKDYCCTLFEKALYLQASNLARAKKKSRRAIKSYETLCQWVNAF